MRVIVTGAAGFIGNATCLELLERGDKVIGIDCLTDYYDVSLKKARLARTNDFADFHFYQTDIADAAALAAIFKQHRPHAVINLAAQAGVRYSMQNPAAYVHANLVGFANILECARQHKIKHLVYASTSSAYGANTQQPFSEAAATDHPMSFYAATKKANEVMAHSYASLYNLPCTGLRFFTVYGPWGRPDMALFKFTKNILQGLPIDVYNNGNMQRDFTYVDDIVEGIVRVLDLPAEVNKAWHGDAPDAGSSYAPARIYNIGNSKPVQLMDYIHAIEKALSMPAKLNMMPMQPGDVPSTYADTSRLKNDINYQPATEVSVGVQRFVDWYLQFYRPTIPSTQEMASI